jgi:very-short-patch-repair endonuclease
MDVKFRRQHPIGKYFADFACIEYGIVVELDGGQHADQVAYDSLRTAFIQQSGFEVMRFWNNDVLVQTDAVLEQIMRKLQALTPTLSRVRERAQETSTYSQCN